MHCRLFQIKHDLVLCGPGLDRDLGRLDRGVGRLLHSDVQHTLIKARANIVGVGVKGQRHRAREAAPGPLRDMIILTFVLFAILALPVDRHHIAGDGDVDILFVEAGKFRLDVDLLVGLADIQPRRHIV